jgi:hypothetical protein
MSEGNWEELGSAEWTAGQKRHFFWNEGKLRGPALAPPRVATR